MLSFLRTHISLRTTAVQQTPLLCCPLHKLKLLVRRHATALRADVRRLLLGVPGELMNQAQTLSVERDWVVVIAERMRKLSASASSSTASLALSQNHARQYASSAASPESAAEPIEIRPQREVPPPLP